MKEKGKNKDKKKQRIGASDSENVRTKWFCCTTKLGFFQFIRKSFLIFRSNLELAFLIILKERELYKSRLVVVECM